MRRSVEKISSRKFVDWIAIEREYRTGQHSIAEIGRRFGISHPAILKRAKRDGWTRNFAAEAREAVTAKSEVTGEPRAGEDVFVTYLPGDGDPPTTQWRGVEFRAGVPKQLTDPAHIEAAKTNRFFRVGKGDPSKPADHNPNDGFVWPT